jgi:2-dehydro-3-deoxygluconokinase
MRRVLGLGESLLRLSTPGHERLEHAGSLRIDVGGAELNALIAAAALGLDAVWVTRLADNPLGRRIAAHAATHGVRTVVDWVGGARAPLYFVELGAPPRPSEVLYDRSGTAMAALEPSAFDWTRELDGCAVALASGITCALGEGPARTVQHVLSRARGLGVRTVFDVNHRDRLWTWDRAAPVLRDLLADVDVLVANRHDLERLVGAEGDGPALARRAIERFGHELVLLRESVAVDGSVAVTVAAVGALEEHVSETHEAEAVDAFGAGDAALGAFLAGLLGHGDLSAAIDQAARACAFQHTVPGDACLLRRHDLAHRPDRARRILR